MAIRKVLILSAVLHLLAITEICAQDTSVNSAGIKWTLQECIEYAKMHNVQINTFRLSQQSAQQDLLLSKASRLPNLSGSASQSLSRGKNINTLTGNLQDKTNLTGNYSLSSSVTLYNGFYINNDIKQKGLLVQAGNLNILQGENDITLQVTQAFLNILLVKENIVYLQDLINTSANQVKRQQQLYDAGSIPRQDLVQMQAQYATDIYTLVTAKNSYRQNILTLKQLLLLPLNTSFDVSAPDSVNVQRIYPVLSEVVNAALQNRPEVKNGQLNVKVAQLDLQNTKTVLAQQVEQAYINVQNAESQYDAAVEELKYAQESYRIANEQLKLGAINTVELLLQKNLYVQALQAYTQAKYNTVLYIKIYAFYMGNPVTL